MEIQTGDRVLVNVAPFIGSIMRSDESIPCEVLDVDGIQVHVRAEPPYRGVSLWILSDWVDYAASETGDLSSASDASSSPKSASSSFSSSDS